MDYWFYIQKLDLADPLDDQGSSIDMILGTEVYSHVIKEGVRKAPLGSHTAEETSLSWMLSGLFSEESSLFVWQIFGLQYIVDYEFLDLLRRFLVQEDLPTLPFKFILDEEDSEKLLLSTYQYLEDGPYIIRLLIMDRKMNFGDSRSAAHRMFMSLEKHFRGNPVLRQFYAQSIQEYVVLGKMDLVFNLDL